MPAALFDVNVWVALAFTTHPQHQRAKQAFEAADSRSPAVTCRAIQQSFLRLATTPAIQKCYGSERITNAMAWDRWQLLLDFPQTLHQARISHTFRSESPQGEARRGMSADERVLLGETPR